MDAWAHLSEDELVRAGREALRGLRFSRARDMFEEYLRRLEKEGRGAPAGVLANYALAVGKTGDVKHGIGLCQAALKANRKVAEVYYCLAQLYLMSGSRKQAFETVGQGLACGPAHLGLRETKARMGVRGSPIVPFLHRDNPINVRLGRALRSRRGKKKSPVIAA
jgi:tetratricopeptide (TPR) repeat protein